MARTLTHEVQEHGVLVNIHQDGVEILDNLFPSIPAFVENAVADIDEELNMNGHNILTTVEKQTIQSWIDGLE